MITPTMKWSSEASARTHQTWLESDPDYRAQQEKKHARRLKQRLEAQGEQKEASEVDSVFVQPNWREFSTIESGNQFETGKLKVKLLINLPDGDALPDSAVAQSLFQEFRDKANGARTNGYYEVLCDRVAARWQVVSFDRISSSV